MPHNQFNNLKNLILPQGGKMKFYSVPALEKMGFGKISRLPVCIRFGQHQRQSIWNLYCLPPTIQWFDHRCTTLLVPLNPHGY